jgi:hypothetical protein
MNTKLGDEREVNAHIDLIRTALRCNPMILDDPRPRENKDRGKELDAATLSDKN